MQAHVGFGSEKLGIRKIVKWGSVNSRGQAGDILVF